jgi:hypothetical protein
VPQVEGWRRCAPQVEVEDKIEGEVEKEYEVVATSSCQTNNSN